MRTLVRTSALAALALTLVSASATLAGRRDRELRVVSIDNSPTQIVSQRTGAKRDFVGGLSIEVKNVTDKPLYYVSYVLILTDTAKYLDGAPVAYNLNWGNVALAAPGVLPGPQDAALAPGQTVTLAVSPAKWQTYVSFAKAKGVPVTTRAELRPYIVAFGDGSGWIGGNTWSADMAGKLEEVPAGKLNFCRYYVPNGPDFPCTQCDENATKWLYCGTCHEPFDQQLQNTSCLIPGEPFPIVCQYQIVVSCP
jgi:hypothetical protein